MNTSACSKKDLGPPSARGAYPFSIDRVIDAHQLLARQVEVLDHLAHDGIGLADGPIGTLVAAISADGIGDAAEVLDTFLPIKPMARLVVRNVWHESKRVACDRAAMG